MEKVDMKFEEVKVILAAKKTSHEIRARKETRD